MCGAASWCGGYSERCICRTGSRAGRRRAELARRALQRLGFPASGRSVARALNLDFSSERRRSELAIAPANWATLRQWENSHLAGAVGQLLAVGSLIVLRWAGGASAEPSAHEPNAAAAKFAVTAVNLAAAVLPTYRREQ
jgi:hypothetical protein